jgi:FkbM family methyltransferase
VIEELAPGVPAVRVRSAYDVQRHTPERSTTVVVNSGLFVRTRARPKTPVIFFQPDQPLGTPDTARLLGWLVRVDVDVRSGSATLGYTIDDGRTIRGELAIDSSVHQVDLLLDDSARDAQLVLRAGANTPTELIIREFVCYGLLDEASEILDVPGTVTLKPMPRWSRFFGSQPPGLTSRVRHLRFSRLAEPRTMRWLHGLELVLVPEEQTSRAVYVSGLYEPCSTSVLRVLLAEGKTCIDVGANVGLVSLLASRWVGPAGRVISFEPSAREFARLREHIERNALANVQAVRSAVGNHDGTAMLRVADPNKAGHNTLEDRFVSANVIEAYAEIVSVIRLDDYVSANDVTKVDVIKIDVEGSEAQVIAGAQRAIARDRPALLIEVAGSATASDHQGRLAIESSLRQLGYVFVAIDGDAGSLKHVADLTAKAENFLAALADTVDAVHREIPIAGWRPRSSGIIAGPMESGNETPYVSIVLTGRNGGFGGDFNENLFRTLEFNRAQLSARGIRHEFIFVEWRPEPGAPWLAELLADRFTSLVPETLRFVVVDGAYHDALSLNPRLQFQEFIAKNVGIRRSRGVFALTTNPGIVLSRGVLDLMEQRSLQPRVLYRAARVDLRKDLDSYRTDWSVLEDERNHEQINRIEPPIYSNAAGDFLLLDRESYLELRGFNEVYRVADAHIDRNFCVKALSSGLTLTSLDAPVYRLGAGPFNDQMAGDADRFAETDWSERRWRGAVLYDNDADWGLGRAPVRHIRAGLDFLEFSWAAVPPAVSLRRVVLPVARQRAAESPGVEWRPEMDRSPYPVTVTHREAASSGASDRTDQRVSHHDPAGTIDRARLEFLATLDLPLQGTRVLDVGCGVGFHTPFYTSRGCRVVGIDGRAENIEEMKQRFPQVEGLVGDVQTMDLEALGSFDVVHALGLLDHLDSPVEALRRLANVCRGQLVLDTIVCDADQAIMILADEVGSANQALAGLGCRPSPSFVAMALDRLGFPYVYGTTMPPQHRDFQFEWRNNLDARRDGANLRCMFVASRTPLACDHLTLLLPAGSTR